MQTDFSLFRERLAAACGARGVTETKVCASIGLGAKRALHLALAGPHAIDVYRLCQIADKLDVSTDWLLGRSNVMDVMEMPEFEEFDRERKPPAKSKRRSLPGVRTDRPS